MILALDASCADGSAALVDAGRLLREEAFAGGRERGGGGAAAAIQGFASSGCAISCVIVGLGPGSYSGIRSAVATAWGFASTRGIPLHGVSSLLAIGTGEYLAVGDARQQQFYFAHVKDGTFVVSPQLLDAKGLVARCAYFADLPAFAPTDVTSVVSRAEIATPRASLLASLVPEDFDPEAPVQCRGLPPMPCPIYLKPPSITQPGAGKARQHQGMRSSRVGLRAHRSPCDS